MCKHNETEHNKSVDISDRYVWIDGAIQRYYMTIESLYMAVRRSMILHTANTKVKRSLDFQPITDTP